MADHTGKPQTADNSGRDLSTCSAPQGEGPWMRYAGFVESGDPHSSQHVDEIVYGPKG